MAKRSSRNVVAPVVEPVVEVTFHDKINNGYFSMQDMPYPARITKPLILRNKIDPTTITQEMLTEIAKAKAEWEDAEATQKVALEAYRAESAKREGEFRKEIEIEHGTSHLPESVRSRIYSLAYEDGHSYGYSEISDHYSDYAELVLFALAETKK